jgi:hypothetical protein
VTEVVRGRCVSRLRLCTSCLNVTVSGQGHTKERCKVAFWERMLSQWAGWMEADVLLFKARVVMEAPAPGRHLFVLRATDKTPANSAHRLGFRAPCPILCTLSQYLLECHVFLNTFMCLHPPHPGQAGEGLGKAMSMTDSGESLVQVLVRHVYRSITLEFTLPLEGSTVHAVKKRVEAALEEKPAPHRQRLIYLGKVCADETAPLAGILTGGTGNDHKVRGEGWGRVAGGRVGKFRESWWPGRESVEGNERRPTRKAGMTVQERAGYAVASPWGIGLAAWSHC